METTIKSKKRESNGDKKREVAIQLNLRLIRKIERHILGLQCEDRNNTNRRKWISEAVKEKLSIPLNPERSKNEDSKQTFRLSLDDKEISQLKDRVRQLKEVHGMYSIKRFVVSAIEEKMEKEESLPDIPIKLFIKELSKKINKG
jgi:hypothetical protein